MIQVIKVNKNLNEYSEIVRLMKTAFSENEQFPMWLLNLMAKRKNIDFLAYFDEDIFCGFSYMMTKDNGVFVLYFAINGEIRSKGYGTKILQEIKKRHQGKNIYLNIERLDKKSENYEQKVRRYEFYKKNGFVATNFFIHDKGEKYLILSTNSEFSVEKYRSILKQFTFGLFVPKVSKDE